MFHSPREMSPVVNRSGGSADGVSNPPPRPRAKSSLPAHAEIQVVYETAEGVTLRGTPLHLNRYAVVWELHNPGIAPRLSETLEHFKIIFRSARFTPAAPSSATSWRPAPKPCATPHSKKRIGQVWIFP